MTEVNFGMHTHYLGAVWLFPILHLAVIVFVLVLMWRVMRALERIAGCMERNNPDAGGGGNGAQ